MAEIDQIKAERIAKKARNHYSGNPRRADALKKVRALRGGASTMREERNLSEYLPRDEREDDATYKARAKRSNLYSFLSKAIEDVADHIFAKPVTLDKSASEEWNEIADNIDLCGQSLNEFMRDILEDALEAGISFILVDMPSPDPNMSLADQNRMNIRPYFSKITVEQVLGFRTQSIANNITLQQIRIMETAEVVDPENPYEDKEVQQVRLLEVGEDGKVFWELWREGQNKKWALHDEGVTEAEEITIVPVYTKRTGFFTGFPRFEALADLNIEHWQKASKFTIGEGYAVVPFLFGAGFADGNFTLAANAMVTNSDPNSKLDWVETQARALPIARQTLKDIEERAMTFGFEMILPKSGQITATGEALDAAKTKTPLATLSQGLKSAADNCFIFAAMYWNKTDVPAVEVFSDFALSAVLGNMAVDQLTKARMAGLITQETYLHELQRRGFISGEIDVEEEIDRLDEEDDDDLVGKSFNDEDDDEKQDGEKQDGGNVSSFIKAFSAAMA
ncbi:DUF4055 domain-containing protein [Cognatishimia sp.]|uniref:DUF4055 domain-containing protein n=1 Tax=Cognatishimia sp. TaxID=2211648 RepID=UPI0035185A61|nr:DUF4055 domain-containing protein [Cognatishimia sp.]